MNPALGLYLDEKYSEGRSDLMTAFVLRCLCLVSDKGLLACVTLDSWMFLSSYVGLRAKLLNGYSFESLLHIGWNCFPDGHPYNRGVAFVIANRAVKHTRSRYVNLSDVAATIDKEELFLERLKTGASSFTVDAKQFSQIPGQPIAYWTSNKFRDAFASSSLSEHASPRQGLATGDNGVFLRFWYEVELTHIGLNCKSRIEAEASRRRWFPYNKGGEYRRWYGNQTHVVNWSNDGEQIRAFVGENGRLRSRPQNMDYFFRPSVSWSKIGSGFPSFRLFPDGFVFDVAGTSIFADREPDLIEILGFTNSVLVRKILEIFSPTLNFEVGHICSLPYRQGSISADVNGVVESLLTLARADWNNFETSWDFRDQPLLRPGLKGATLEASWRNWEAQSTAAIRRMQELETENNRLFIAAYGLDGELQPEVPEEQITLARADARRDMAAFLSYAVGCMMGRYSLDQPGLILANAGDSLREFLEKAGKPLAELTFAPDEDGIIPVLDGEWFEDDIVARTRDFLRATFGEATLRENLRFIEDSLGKDLRKYFLNDFYKDHLQTYKKRPIYWMVQSPRRGFSVLLYLHRYTRDTMNLVLNRYLRDYQVKLRNRLAHVSELQVTGQTAKAKTDARKEADKLTKILHECDEWERQTILPLAQARIELNLDDGVKVNYLKLGESLAPIAGLALKDEN